MRAPRDFRAVHVLGDEHIGPEARAASDDHLSVKVWLRLLACSMQIEQEIRRRLRERFGITLARFDYLAQLHRHPDGLRMNALSRYLMVTGGNITGLTDELEKDGMVVREVDPEDRRSYRIRLTPPGRRDFATMAAEHEQWVTELFSGIPAATRETLYELLGRLRVHLAHRQGATDTSPAAAGTGTDAGTTIRTGTGTDTGTGAGAGTGTATAATDKR